ncbi:MAG: EamA family transporter [Melioribacteraceae bacterium]|nr:EamA family transporter [Melioribacteraceae bacterium]
MNKDKSSAYLSLFSIYIVWGTTYLAIRIGVEDLPPVLFAGLRWFIAGPIMFLFLAFRKYKLPTPNDIIHLSISGILMLGVGNGFVVFAEQYISSGLAALLITTTPFWMVGIESLLPGKSKPNLIVMLGIVVGLIGVILIFGSDFKELFKPENILGVVSILLAVIGWAGGTIYSKYKKVSIAPLMGAAVQMSIAGIVMTLFGISIGEIKAIQFSSEGLIAFFYLVAVGSWIGYGSYIYALNHLPVSLVSTYAYVNPVIALFLGWLILDEQITTSVIVAAIVIFAGVLLVKKGSENYTPQKN